MGNLTISYAGRELLPELISRGRLIRWWREANALVAGRMRWRGALVQSFGPWFPAALWVWLNRIYNHSDYDVLSYTAVHPTRLAELDLSARARHLNYDPVFRSYKDSFATRLLGLRGFDPGNANKGILGGWHIDHRDPTADVRLMEFCLAVPDEQFLCNGVYRALARRALADRLPKRVLDEP